MTGTLSCSIFQNVMLIIKKYKCTRMWKMVKISRSMRREREFLWAPIFAAVKFGVLTKKMSRRRSNKKFDG